GVCAPRTNGRCPKGPRPPERKTKIAIRRALCFGACFHSVRRQGACHGRIGARLRRGRILHFSHHSRSILRRSARSAALRGPRAKDYPPEITPAKNCTTTSLWTTRLLTTNL